MVVTRDRSSPSLSSLSSYTRSFTFDWVRHEVSRLADDALERCLLTLSSFPRAKVQAEQTLYTLPGFEPGFSGLLEVGVLFIVPVQPLYVVLEIYILLFCRGRWVGERPGGGDGHVIVLSVYLPPKCTQVCTAFMYPFYPPDRQFADVGIGYA